jgi:tripartite-type tricarboxylate transporter receptor subunit TctC
MERIVMAPADTPDERIDVLRDAFQKLYEDKTFLKLMKQMDENLNYLDGVTYSDVRRTQSATYKELVKSLR